MSPLKRALRNSVLLAFMIIGVVYYQSGSTQESLLTGLMTFVITFAALWLSFSYTQKLAEKYQVNEEREQRSSSKQPTTDLNSSVSSSDKTDQSNSR